MKCVKSIKKTKEVEVGEIRRVSDKTAQNMVGSFWKYISKTEWKLDGSKNNPVEQTYVTQSTETVVKSSHKKDSKPAKKTK